MIENPEYYQKKMKTFIAIAPTLRLNNLKSLYMNTLFHTSIAMPILEQFGPELFDKPLISPGLSGVFSASLIGVEVVY